MVHVEYFFYVLIVKDKDFKLFVLSSNRTNQSVSILGELYHSTVREEREEFLYSIAAIELST